MSLYLILSVHWLVILCLPPAIFLWVFSSFVSTSIPILGFSVAVYFLEFSLRVKTIVTVFSSHFEFFPPFIHICSNCISNISFLRFPSGYFLEIHFSGTYLIGLELFIYF
jgi:hypothetical protein